jgi:hypothetical protein
MDHPLTAPDRPPDSLPIDFGELPPLPPKWSAPAATTPLNEVWQKLSGVKITCTGASCENGLHCFRLTKKMAASLGPGRCRYCKEALISLNAVAERDLGRVDYTFAALQKEFIRHYFWHVPFGEKALKYAENAGRVILESRVPNRLQKRIGSADNPYDGRQTPVAPARADAIDMAMHAVAACCRKCAEYWHGIQRGRPLSDEELDYLGELVNRFLRARLPDLDDRPIREVRLHRVAEVRDLPTRSLNTGHGSQQIAVRHKAS